MIEKPEKTEPFINGKLLAALIRRAADAGAISRGDAAAFYVFSMMEHYEAMGGAFFESYKTITGKVGLNPESATDVRLVENRLKRSPWLERHPQQHNGGTVWRFSLGSSVLNSTPEIAVCAAGGSELSPGGLEAEPWGGLNFERKGDSRLSPKVNKVNQESKNEVTQGNSRAASRAGTSSRFSDLLTSDSGRDARERVRAAMRGDKASGDALAIWLVGGLRAAGHTLPQSHNGQIDQAVGHKIVTVTASGMSPDRIKDLLTEWICGLPARAAHRDKLLSKFGRFLERRSAALAAGSKGPAAVQDPPPDPAAPPPAAADAANRAWRAGFDADCAVAGRPAARAAREAIRAALGDGLADDRLVVRALVDISDQADPKALDEAVRRACAAGRGLLPADLAEMLRELA